MSLEQTTANLAIKPKCDDLEAQHNIKFGHDFLVLMVLLQESWEEDQETKFGF